jgi:hypothetical protein
MTGYCENNNKTSGSIKGTEYFDQLNVLLPSEASLCTMDMVG